MIQDDLTKKIAAAAMDIMAEDNTNKKSDDGEGLDKVQPKAVKKKFDDRKDKDIDNDGDIDSSDEYLHKRRKAISKATTEETELEEATELYKKGKITLTKFAMGKGKGAGLQINYGMKFIQLPAKDIKQLYTAMVYITKSVPQFKESVEIEESVELQEAVDFGEIEKVMKWAKKNLSGAKLDISKKYGTAFISLTIFNVITLRLGGKKGIVVTHDDRTNGKGRGKEEHFSSANDVIKYVEKIAPKNESVEEATELEEASKDWEVVVTMGVNKLKKGQKVVVKARTSSEAIKKAAKAFNINDKLITGKVDANLKESTEVELQEGRFDKLEKKLGRINPESLEGVMSGKIKLNPAEKKEFDEFMKGVRKMFASTNY